MPTLSPVSSSALLPAPNEELRRATSVSPAGQTDNGASGNEQSFSFSDFLSIINPLQHIPIVGTIYRAITGDTIKPAARVIGGALFGGPVGLITSAFNAMVEQTKGKDLGEQAIALFSPDKSPVEPPTQFAEATTASPKPTEAAAAPAVPQDAAVPDAAVAPVSRGLFTARTTLPPNSASTLGPERTLTASLRGQQQGTNGATSGSQGRTIADYRNFSGRPLPVVDANRSTSTQSAPIRLQPSVPMSEKPRTPPAAAAEPAATREAAPAQPAIGTTAETTGTTGTPAPASDWFTAAMARGLDRYREQHRQAAPPALRLDATL
jgi:hypothetical protein